ncbi:MAG: hypothetical protein MR835_03655 [Erysipelotrichaceae bacterium]|nr:hypothetical protein [Erysipelotrichaceae bacterium]MDY3934356.1 hypothetical protein [Bacilli bacterium]
MEKVDNKKELNTITLELLDRTNELKNSIMNSMVIGDSSIIEGIIIFEEVLMMINPTDINEEITQQIQKNIEKELIKNRGNFKLINKYVRNGVEYCYSILYYFEKSFVNGMVVYSKTKRKNKINR